MVHSGSAGVSGGKAAVATACPEQSRGQTKATQVAFEQWRLRTELMSARGQSLAGGGDTPCVLRDAGSMVTIL